MNTDIKKDQAFMVTLLKERDARSAETKEVVTKLIETNSNNVISLKVRADEDTKPISYSIQTDLSRFVDFITPADAA